MVKENLIKDGSVNMENMSKAVRNVLIVMIAVIILGVVAKTSAQDDVPQVYTSFTVSCQNGSPDHIYILAESNGVETYTVSTYPGSVAMSIPVQFTTHEGKYLLGWFDGSSLNMEIHFTNADGFDAVMPIQPDYFTWCDHDDETPIPTPAPDATAEPVVDAPQCKASAVNQATGHAYCYDPDAQPQNLDGAVVPVPPAN